MSEDGKIMWKTKREPIFDKGSMILVDDLILLPMAKPNFTLLNRTQPDLSHFHQQAIKRKQNFWK